MTNDQIELVQNSFTQVAPIAETAAGMFYGRLFEMNPALRPLFKGDMEEQGRKLMDMIAVAVNGLDRLDEIVPPLEDPGPPARGLRRGGHPLRHRGGGAGLHEGAGLVDGRFARQR